MTYATVASYFNKSLDIKRSFSSEIALDLYMMVDVLTKLRNVVLGKILNSRVGIDTGCLNNVAGGFAADTVYIGKTNFNSLLSGKINTGYTRHLSVAPPLRFYQELSD